MINVERSIVVTTLVAAYLACAICCNQHNMLAKCSELPFGIEGVQLGMKSSELIDARPGAISHESDQNYFEELPEGQPYTATVTYTMKGDSLAAISFWRSWKHDGQPQEIVELTPGLVRGAYELWGVPSTVGVVARKHGEIEMLNVNMRWEWPDCVITVEYPSQATVDKVLLSDTEFLPLGIHIDIATASYAKYLRQWSPLITEQSVVDAHYHGIPDEGEIEGAILH